MTDPRRAEGSMVEASDREAGEPVGGASALDVEGLLISTSRTFAVSIPLLEEPTRMQVGLAYLLFRIADTFEDAASWQRAWRVSALEQFAELVRGDRADGAQLARAWMRQPPTEHRGYLDLLEKTPEVLETARHLPPASWEVVSRHTLRTCEGMRRSVLQADGEGVLELRTMADLRSYCYVVAGIGPLKRPGFRGDSDDRVQAAVATG